MCLVVVLYRVIAGAPVLIAANREERFDRPALPPRVFRGPPRYTCGIDQQAGGTWLGVNQYGVVVAVTNREKTGIAAAPRSRGLLCLDLLSCKSARDASQRAADDLTTGSYAGANFLCIDAEHASVIYGGREIEVIEMPPGLHLLTNGNLDDPDDRRQSLAQRLMESSPLSSVDGFMERTARLCAHKGIVVHRLDGGTVCADQIAVTDRVEDAVYRHAPGPPDRLDFDDVSGLLHRVLAAPNPDGA